MHEQVDASFLNAGIMSSDVIASMRLLHVVPTYLPATRYGGPIYSVHALCAALARRGHEVHVFTTNVDGPGVSPVPLGVPIELDGVHVTYFPTALGRRLYRSPAMGRALLKTIADFDLAHLHSVFLWPTLVAAKAARATRVPYVLAPRGMLVKDLISRKSLVPKLTWMALFERANVENAAAVHVTAEIEAAEIKRLGFKCRRIALVPNGIDLPLPSDCRIPDTKPFVLFLGRISWKKGLDRLIAAMAHVPGGELVIAGNDEEGLRAKLELIARDADVAERVRFIGPVRDEAKWRLIRSAALFALPSYSENFGIAVLEAMACGVPVVVTPEVGLAKTVREVGAGLVVDGDAQKLGQAIGGLLADPDQRQALGAAGRNSAETRFSWNAIAWQMAEVYRELTTCPRI